MKTFNQTILVALFGLIGNQAEAKSIHNSCLTMSDQVAGIEEGTFVTNEDQLTSRAVSDDMRLQGITTCHTEGKVTGLQFHMALDPYEAVDEEVYDMTPIGLMSGECEKLDLPQGLDKVKATMNPLESSLSIKYKIFDTDLLQTYGEFTSEKTTWSFSEENPLIGLYGRQTEYGIAQLGFITLDTACQLAHIEIPDPVTPETPVVDPTPTDPTTEPVTEPETEEGIIFGLGIMPIALIIGGVLLLAALAAATICSFIKRKGENQIVSEPRQSKIKPTPETDRDLENSAQPVNVNFYSADQKAKVNKQSN